MSVENLKTIDVVSINKDGNVVLTISDDLKWDKENTHLLKLQNKINAYLDSIDNGSLIESYPKAQGRKIIINVFFKFLPNNDGQIFLQRTKETIEKGGYGFTFKHVIE